MTSHQIDDAFASGQGEAQPRGHAVIDSGATETVGSLPAIEDLMAVRYELNGVPDSFQISSTPPRRFRFGNGSIGFSLSQMFIPQDLGPVRVDLGVFSLDVENVPILIGIKTLRALRTVLDCHQDVAVFAALDPSTGVKLRRSPSGHLLIDLSRNWLQDSFSILSPAARIPEVPPTTFEAEENIGAVFVLEPLPSDFQARGDTHLEYEAAPESPSSCPAVLFHSRGCADSAPGEDSSGCLEDPFRILRALVRGHGHSDCREQRLVCGCGGSFSGQGQSCGEACSVKGKGKGTKPKAEPAPELDWSRIEEANPRDVRLKGPPCMGPHVVATRSNQHATWQLCTRCSLRLTYIPRVGKTGLHRAARPLNLDVQEVVTETKEDLAFNPRLKDQAIALQAAENSVVRQLEKIRTQKDKVIPKQGPMGASPLPPSSPSSANAGAASPKSTVVVNLEEASAEGMNQTPGNKRHQAIPAEEQEYQTRTQGPQ